MTIETPTGEVAPPAEGQATAGELLSSTEPTTPTGEVAPTTETKPAEGETKPAAETKPAEPEVKYEFKAPEGVELDAPRLEKFTALAKELKLAPDQAQKFVDMAAEAELDRMNQHAEAVKGWAKQVREDKEIGGDKLAENLAIAKKTFGLLPAEQATELKGLLTASGLEAHPLMVKLFHAVGKSLSEDRFVAAGRAAEGKKSMEQRLYGNSANATA